MRRADLAVLSRTSAYRGTYAAATLGRLANEMIA
jgi:hypothetical protein